MSGMRAVAVLIAAMLAAESTGADGETGWQEPGWAALAGLGAGTVAWESSRGGRWRIWARDLDGGHRRQVTPDEDGRDHFCPHWSPDGRRLAFLSFPSGRDGYGDQPGPTGARLCVLEAGAVRALARDVRTYREDRAVTWIDATTLAFIDDARHTCRLDVIAGTAQRLTAEPATSAQAGWLPDATLRWATTGAPRFAAWNAGRPAGGEALEGCQPYFSHDGRFGFWSAGAGGPLNRIELASGAVAPIVRARDHRLPRERGYVYFPMLSRCGRLFAFAASPGVHDHFQADYDIYVAACDPVTLTLVGAPVRYSRDGACDRFPDVTLAAGAVIAAPVAEPVSTPPIARGPLPRWQARLRRVRASTPPTLVQIRPYREALVVNEYAVEAQTAGDPLPALVRVVDWAIRDGAVLANPGDGAADLDLERWDDHPALHQRVRTDQLPPAPDLPMFLRVRFTP